MAGEIKGQWARTLNNKERAWKRHLRVHPQDDQAIEFARVRLVNKALAAR